VSKSPNVQSADHIGGEADYSTLPIFFCLFAAGVMESPNVQSAEDNRGEADY
jgi:hypothetical protein